MGNGPGQCSLSLFASLQLLYLASVLCTLYLTARLGEAIGLRRSLVLRLPMAPRVWLVASRRLSGFPIANSELLTAGNPTV